MWRGTDDRQLNNATHSPDQHAEKEKNKPTNQTASGRAPVFNCSTATGGLLKEGRGKERKTERDDKCRDQRNPQKKIKDDKQLKRKDQEGKERKFGEREREKGERIWMRICVLMGVPGTVPKDRIGNFQR